MYDENIKIIVNCKMNIVHSI